jgi:hypothetical protein
MNIFSVIPTDTPINPQLVAILSRLPIPKASVPETIVSFTHQNGFR